MAAQYDVNLEKCALIDSYRQKKKKKQQHGSGREWESFFREWNSIFPQFFRGIGTGRD